MYYFNNEFLKQYIKLNGKLKIFINGSFYSIADETDLADTRHGVGYDENGKPYPFDYRDIQSISFGPNVNLSLDDLQTKMNADAEPPTDEAPKDDAAPTEEPADDDEPPTEEEPADKKNPPKESFLNKGDLIVDEFHKGVIGSVISISENYISYRSSMYSNAIGPAGSIKPGDIIRTEISNVKKLRGI